LTASQQIKAAFPEAKVCIVTDYGDNKAREVAIAAWACAYIVKEELHMLRHAISRATELGRQTVATSNVPNKRAVIK
jgi:DNA-binding NarL/FixJ family response regulator